MPYDLPEGWAWTNLETITYPVGNKNNQIQTSSVKPTGKVAVVSQGQELYDGFCDDENKAIHDLPTIMFGDHTRNVKYIDFPFVIGADGTKFHKAITIEPKYIFYWMLYAAEILRNRGYARHYSLLKKQLLPLPPLAEQARIVGKVEELVGLCGELRAENEK